MIAADTLSFATLSITYAAPLLYVSLGEVFSERAGVINIGLEGLLLLGCLGAVVGASFSGSPLVGVFAGIGFALVGACVFAVWAIGLRRDQVIVGTTLNFLALGITGMLYRGWTQNGTRALTAPTLPALVGSGPTALGPLTLLALVLVPISQWLLFHTRLGVVLRAVGEVPAAAAASGASVNRIRVCVTLVTGALCGLGGSALAIGIGNSFIEGMTAGRGFIALAIVVFGRWTPTGALVASLLFAAADVLQARLQASDTFAVHVPYPVFLALPYLLTLFALALRGAKVKAPRALGQPWEQG